MKKYMITIVAAMVLGLAANSQEVMKVEMKNGQVTTFPVENINRFYFEGAQQQEELASNCEISIVDEVVFNKSAALKLNYGSAIEYVIWGWATPSQIAQLTDEQIVQAIIQGGGLSAPISRPYIEVGFPNEGTDYVILYYGINAEKKRGQLYRYYLTSTVAANELKAEVTSVKRFDDNFQVTINIDKSKVMKYFAVMEAGGDDLEFFNSALLALYSKELINAQQNIYTESRTASYPRNNGEERLWIATWACDYSGKWSGYLYQDIFQMRNGSQTMKAVPVKSNDKITIRAYSEEELLKKFDFKRNKLIEK